MDRMNQVFMICIGIVNQCLKYQLDTKLLELFKRAQEPKPELRIEEKIDAPNGDLTVVQHYNKKSTKTII